MKFLAVSLVIATLLSGCSNWIYRIDVPQGNFLDERDVEKLRIGMNKDQVIFVLGHPVVQDSFDHDTWYYVYDMKRGMQKRGDDFRKSLVINFEDNKIASVDGDCELSEEFMTPLDQQASYAKWPKSTWSNSPIINVIQHHLVLEPVAIDYIYMKLNN